MLSYLSVNNYDILLWTLLVTSYYKYCKKIKCKLPSKNFFTKKNCDNVNIILELKHIWIHHLKCMFDIII